EKLQCKPEDVTYASAVFRSGEGASISIEDLMRATLTEGAVIGRGVSTKLQLLLIERARFNGPGLFDDI
ncbi:MAG TPA: hypothetical protein PKH72_07240, partial [Rhodoferax sp.]|nr:hypothetical protein [Rhodoferax sp.]